MPDKNYTTATGVTVQPVPMFNVDPTTGLAVVPGGGGGGGATPTIVWTQTFVALAAVTSATFIAANANRKALRWMVTGVNPMTVVPGTGPAVANVGMNYNGNASTGNQGGSDSFYGELSTQAFTAISTLGTTITVWEGA